jgi:MinD-like ATPase involved in chromosome partitioning or flagellar assembly
VSELSDKGKPVVVAAPESETAKAFKEMARKVSEKLPVK